MAHVGSNRCFAVLESGDERPVTSDLLCTRMAAKTIMKNTIKTSGTELSQKASRIWIYNGIFDFVIIPYLLVVDTHVLLEQVACLVCL